MYCHGSHSEWELVQDLELRIKTPLGDPCPWQKKIKKINNALCSTKANKGRVVASFQWADSLICAVKSTLHAPRSAPLLFDGSSAISYSLRKLFTRIRIRASFSHTNKNPEARPRQNHQLSVVLAQARSKHPRHSHFSSRPNPISPFNFERLRAGLGLGSGSCASGRYCYCYGYCYCEPHL